MVLKDITAFANNANMTTSSPRTDEKHSPVKIGEIRKSRSPHFMTPTFASKRSHFDNPSDHTGTPVKIRPIKADGGSSLLKSAAKRVGLHFGADGTPREKKEGPSKHVGVASFTDKLSVSPHSKIPESFTTPPKKKNEASSESPFNKPLPTPPSTPFDMNDPVRSSMSLIEAVNKPLPSFDSGSSSSEEWTVLEPTRPLSPGTLQKMVRKTGKELKQQSISGERYPKLGSAIQQPQTTDQRPVVSRHSPIHQIPRKEGIFAANRKSSNTTGELHIVNGVTNPFGNSAESAESVRDIKAKASLANLAGAAAAVEKSTKDVGADPTPRQTKTSILRARLSTSQLIKDEQTKVLGSTDFTTPRATSDSTVGPNRGESYHARKEAQTRRSTESLHPSVGLTQSLPTLQKTKSVLSLRSNKSTESLQKGHGPALFVGGGRCLMPTPRPSSRGSHRNESRSSNSAQSSRPSSRQSQAILCFPKNSETFNDSAFPIIERQVKPRKSSIPVPTHVALNAMFKANSDGPVTPKSILANLKIKKTPRDEMAIFRDCSSAELLSELETENMSLFKNRGPAQIFKDAKESQYLAAIEESPQHSFTTKRLSIKAPEHGPSLKISSSAERFIMGARNTKDSDKENQPIHEKKAKTVLQKAANGVHKQRTSFPSPASTLKQRPDRPLSSYGILQSSPQHDLTDSSSRERKVKSADLSGTLSLNFDLIPHTSCKGVGASKGSKASSTDDPFFDAPEAQIPAGHGPKTPQNQENKKDIIDEAAWLSRVEKTDQAVTEGDESNHHTSGFRNDTTRDANAQLQTSSPSSPLEDLKVVGDGSDCAQPVVSAGNQTMKPQPPTQIQHLLKTPPSSGSHPPRSSSRVPHPDFTCSAFHVTPSTAERGPPTPPKDNTRQEVIQNNLGFQNGHASSQFDIPHLESSRVSSIRDSIARDSYKSSGSLNVSKNPFSNFRNLFNKRTSTPETSKSVAKKNNTSKSSHVGTKASEMSTKVSIAPSGSPFPPSAQIHPVHRLTLASTNRATTPHQNTRFAATTNTTPSSIHKTTGSTPTLATPAFASPNPTVLSTTTTLTMTLLEAARNERSSARKEKLLQMSKIMVNAITQARDAEKAAEEAKLASRRAEIAKEICAGMVGEVGKLIAEWRGT